MKMNEGDWLTRFIIGHENSPLHRKTSFQIDLPLTPLSAGEGMNRPG